MKTILLLLSFLITQYTSAQVLQPGFNKKEYIETLKINQKAHIPLEKWKENTTLPPPQEFEFHYRSPSVAFDNIWDLWVHKEKKVALIAIRGTVETDVSFLANLYAAMVPATGTLELEKKRHFNYKLATHPNAAVQVGWLIAMSYLSITIEHKIDSCYREGIRDFILTGHSQGGGITYMLTAYLEHLKTDKRLPADIRFKTYCSASPKPGNLFFAYDYEKITQGGWGYNVVNTADWVPDVPFSVQTVDDFTSVNPFQDATAMIKKQKFPKNIVLKRVYNKLSRPSKKAQRNYEKYLGRMISKVVKKQFPEFIPPAYYKSNYYVRTGNTVILYADETYFNALNNDPDKVDGMWQHHQPKQYLYLAEKLD